jgi:predicted helicase
MSNFKLKATHAPVKAYYETLERFGRGKFDNEGNIRSAFEALLEKCARTYEWFVVPEYQIARSGKSPLRVDAAVLDAFNLPRGYWEAKDEKDDLKAEMNKKFALGYPRANILFQRPTHAILFQDGRIAFDDEIETSENLVEVLRLFFEWREPFIQNWESAAGEFSGRLPKIADGAIKLIEGERKTNPAFVERFGAFAELCRESINPDLRNEAVEEMLVQHLLTERIFRRIFKSSEFTRRNVIAIEIERVIDSLTGRYFSRDAFLEPLDRYYKAIEETASILNNYSEKQGFLNTIYEQFFKAVNPKQADTHGIVYTPQPIVDFMVRSVEEVLKAEFGRSLSDKGVHVLDPFVGTGNFITRLMKEIRTSSLPSKYKEELHCNEIMLLPYYIASMNIEHAYLDAVGKYEPFEGICLVDTFDLAEPKQAGFEFMTEGNTERIRKQKKAPIFVVIGNPPYNMGQVNENDENKNRKYKHMDARVRETYTKASKATLRNKLSDPYVKAFRLASDRIRAGGVVAFVSNDSFVDHIAFDGMRKCLIQDFDKIYVLDLGGNVRKNPKLSGTTHNVFGIQVGVAITILVKKTDHQTGEKGQIYYATVGEDWKKQEKYSQLSTWAQLQGVNWHVLVPDSKGTWLTDGQQGNWDSLLLVGDRQAKREENTLALFRSFSLGVVSARDSYLFNFSHGRLVKGVKKFVSAYGEALAKFKAARSGTSAQSFVDVVDQRIKWSRQTKRLLHEKETTEYHECFVRASLYRPYTSNFYYFDDFWNEERYQQPRIFPAPAVEEENRAICCSGVGSSKPFQSLVVNRIISFDFLEKTQCFPYYTYDKDGTNRRENITDWALAEFRAHYGDKKISKWDIFHYTYGLLHHPEYRTKYAANLKRELPRIPMAPEFRRFAEIGAALMKLHIEYEKQAEYPLERRETGRLNWRVEKMALSKDKSQLRYNEFLTLSGIPAEAYEYRLGNRSALEWVVDQYRASTDARSGIVNDPNREDDPEYIVRLVGQVVTVSVETVRLVRELAGLGIDQV